VDDSACGWRRAAVVLANGHQDVGDASRERPGELGARVLAVGIRFWHLVRMGEAGVQIVDGADRAMASLELGELREKRVVDGEAVLIAFIA
jgi:hypothetical protein